MPAQTPHDPYHLACLHLSLIPEEVRKAIGTDELNDRLVEAARLSGQANDAALSLELRRAAKLRAQAVLRAQPRDVTARQHRELVAKAAATRGRFQADAIRRQAERLVEEEHPIAPSRAAGVRKAKAKDAEPVPVFDQNGNLIGICDPDDITPVAGTGKKQDAAAAGQPDAAAGADAQVAKAAGRVVVYDQWRRPYLTDRQSIRLLNVRKVAGNAPARNDDTVTVYDGAGRPYRVSRAVLQSPEVQARNTGPVGTGGTTGLGQPRRTGPAAASPADGPQEAQPGDVPDRQVIKALGTAWTEVRDWRGALAGAVRRSDVTVLPPGRPLTGQAARSHANVYDASRRLVGVAKMADIISLADLRAARRPGG